MNARSETELVLLFAKLSHLPLLCVHKHLNASSLLMISVLSEKWKTIVKKDGKRMGSRCNLRVTHDEIRIHLEFRNKDNEDLAIRFYQNAESRMGMEMEMAMEVEMEVEGAKHVRKPNQNYKKYCLKAFKLLNFLFPITSYGYIEISLGPRSPKFLFRFLSRLPSRTAQLLSFHADQEVDGADLVKFLEKVRVVDKYIAKVKNLLDVGMRIKNLVKSDEIVLGSDEIQISDARFLSIDCLKKLKCNKLFHAGQNDLNSKNFNEFLRAWMNKGHRFPARAKFDIREDQKIKMEEVMEGLNAHVSLPRIRDRWYFEYTARECSHLYPVAIDMADGWNIQDQDDQRNIYTVLFESNRLTFVVWPSFSPWQSNLTYMERSISTYSRSLERLNREHEIIQKKMAVGKMELFPDELGFLEQYLGKMRIEQERLALACEVKEKFLTIWKNDDSVYIPSPPRAVDQNTPPTSYRAILIVGSAGIALDGVPRALQFSIRPGRGRLEYTKIHGTVGIRFIPITDISLVSKDLLNDVNSIIYAYSDSDSLDQVSIQFISLRKMYHNFFNRPIRLVQSILIHFAGKDNDQPDQFDVESFQRNTWSNLYEFDPNSNSPIDSDIEYFIQPIE